MPLSQVAVIDNVEFSFEQTVPRSLVHKRSLDNVLLTEIRADEDDRFLCAGRLPTTHWFFNDAGRTPQKDIFFYTELCQQASLAISHAFLDVDTDDVFIFEAGEAALTEAAWMISSQCERVVVDVKILETTRRKDYAIGRVVAQYNIYLGADRVFRGIGSLTVHPAALYQRLRRMSARNGSATPRATQSDDVVESPVVRFLQGACDNVVISQAEYVDSADEFVASMIVDDGHPYFFDGPFDHVPGMLLLEGCAQLALAAFAETACAAPGTSGICAYDASFVRFVECGLPTTLRACVDTADGSGHSVRISILQNDVACGTTTMSIAFPIGV